LPTPVGLKDVGLSLAHSLWEGDVVRLVERTLLARCRVPVAMAVTLLLVSTVPVTAQDAPRVSVLAGIGNAFGWIGGQVEAYVAQGRVSGFAGLGFMPNVLNHEGDGIAGAVGIRGFTPGNRHRGLLEISLSALSNTVSSTFGSDVVEKSRSYGPGVAIGYQFIANTGFTILVSGGVGLDDEGLDPEGSRLQPTAGIGIGYSVR